MIHLGPYNRLLQRPLKQFKAAALFQEAEEAGFSFLWKWCARFFHFLRLEKVESFVQENRGVGELQSGFEGEATKRA